jgi:chemotaxis signal transduction protein
VDEKTAEAPPNTLQADIRNLIAGVHKLDQGLMHVLNTEKACEPLDISF